MEKFKLVCSKENIGFILVFIIALYFVVENTYRTDVKAITDNYIENADKKDSELYKATLEKIDDLENRSSIHLWGNFVFNQEEKIREEYNKANSKY